MADETEQQETLTPLTLTEARAFIAKSEWIFAKTMPYNPHWYTLGRHGIISEFVAMAHFIRDNGYDELFEGRTYRVMNIDEYKYWTMDLPLEDTDLINRAKIVAL